MGKLPEPASDFLRPEDVEDGNVLKIVAHPETIPAEQSKFGKERHVVTVSLPDGAQKRWGLNLTSYRALYKAFGSDGDDWINQQVKVTKNREKVRGETRYVLYAEPAQQPQQTSLQGINEEALNKLSPEQKQRLIKKLSMQQ